MPVMPCACAPPNVMANEALLIKGKRRFLHEIFHKVAISQVGRDTPRGSVWLVDEMCLFQSGQLMTNGGRTEIQAILAHQRL